jgi:undecaprenyl phosphate N,N'-diacetylbacillosamine 1-phosphate transferase
VDKIYIKFIKKFFDIFVSICILILTSPILIFALITLMISNKSTSVLFFQLRPGLNERIFKLVKIKTMNDKVDHNGKLLSDEQRTTTFGKILRKYSIDELPQLLNVIKGDMSLIGPRPLLVEYLEHYTLEQKRRHQVMPGITGWAQIHGRNALQFNERFKLDVWYVDNISFRLDLLIFYRTIIKIFRSENVLMQDPNKITDMNNFKN